MYTSNTINIKRLNWFFFDQNNNRSISRLLLTGIVLGLISFSWPVTVLSDGTAKHQETEDASFGPGDSYLHPMSVDPEDFKKVLDISKNAKEIPPPIQRDRQKTIEVDLVATEVISEIAPGISYHFWTFDDTVPGTFIRVRVGDTVKLSLLNDLTSSHDHSIDLHAVNGPGGGAVVTNVEPGETKVMTFKTLNPGLFVYHCAAGNAPTHIANGMYGLILVEPEEGLPAVDKEYYLMQGELYTKGALGKKGFQPFDGQKMIDESPEYIVFNGRPGAIVKDGKLTAEVGNKIRLFIGNAGVAKVASFHIIGEIFDRVYPEASTSSPFENVQTTMIPAGGATMVELKVDVPGNYVLVDHALARIDRGAWGILNVRGKKDSSIYSGTSSSSKVKTKKSHSNMGHD